MTEKKAPERPAAIVLECDVCSSATSQFAFESLLFKNTVRDQDARNFRDSSSTSHARSF